MSTKRPSRQHSSIEDLLRAAETFLHQHLNPIASPLPKIQLPKEEPKAPDPTKPLEWFDAYERHNS